MTGASSIVMQYIDLISHLDDENSTKNLESLFSPLVKKIVNSRTVCIDRNQLTKQMYDIQNNYGVDKINLLECIIGNNDKTNVIRFEITYKDGTTESVISILKCDEKGCIEEINEVFGEKEIYQWPTKC